MPNVNKPKGDKANEDTTRLFNSMLELKKRIVEEKTWAAVMFCDLVGSTQFKAERGDTFGLTRTFFHNQLISDTAAQHGGSVVKYIGDECMLLFPGKDGIQSAFAAATSIQTQLRDPKTQNQHADIWPVQTKIGINYGEVLLWRHTKKGQPDPQGTAVDIAARLTSLALPDQVLTSEETAKLAHGYGETCGSRQERWLKGLVKPVNVVELNSGVGFLGVSYPPYHPSSEKDVWETILKVRELEGKKDYDGALVLLTETKARHPSSFLTYFYLGRILEKLNHLDEALEALVKARSLNPNNPAPWLHEAVATWKKLTLAEPSGTLSREHLDELISKSKRCLEAAVTKLDFGHMRRSKGNLAYFLALTNDPNSISEAERLCEQILEEFRLEETVKKAQFLDTYAAVLMAKGDSESLTRAEALLRKAQRADKNNEFVLAKLAKLISHGKARKGGRSRNG